MGELNAYIDEAGDEGFVFRNPASGKSGSSRWFVLVAVAVDSAKDRAVAKAVHRIKQRLWGEVDERPLHWVDLSHSKRKVCIQEIQKEPFSLFAVALNKADPDLDQQKLNPQKVKPPGLVLKNSSISTVPSTCLGWFTMLLSWLKLVSISFLKTDIAFQR